MTQGDYSRVSANGLHLDLSSISKWTEAFLLIACHDGPFTHILNSLQSQFSLNTYFFPRKVFQFNEPAPLGD